MPAFSRQNSEPTRVSGGQIASDVSGAKPAAGSVGDIFRRFFDLIARFERPLGGLETKSASPRCVRITRLDDETSRIP